MKRKYTRPVKVGNLTIGAGARITVQSMCFTDTRDVQATLKQIHALAQAGCDIVRIAVFDTESAQAVKTYVQNSPVPLVADIHFDHKLAILAAENGIAKVRINPGNIGGQARVKELVDCLKMHKIPLRIGVNGGSLDKDIVARDGGFTAQGLVDSALRHVRLLEKFGFDDIVIALKASDAYMTVAANRQLSRSCDYPLHLGVTESGLADVGIPRSAIGIGTLLMEGIGDTIRVSLTGDPIHEVAAGKNILEALGLGEDGLHLISCPACGRCRIDVDAIAKEVKQRVGKLNVNVTAAVMGCVVNGPGEAKQADCGIAGGDGAGALFADGQVRRVEKDDLAGALVAKILELAKEREACGFAKDSMQ